MKNINQVIISSFLLLILISSCDEGFDEMNVNPVQPVNVDPVFLMNNALINTSFPGSSLPYEIAIVQQVVTPFGGVLAGGNFNQDNRPSTRGLWDKYYRNALKHNVDVINATADDAERSNLYNMSRIWHAYIVMLLTDTYGDVPFSEAGKGYIEQTIAPVYNTQSEIYNDILIQLEQASAALDPSKRIEAGDILYAGNIDKWKKLGYSLMLRAAMRLTKVDATKAQEYAAKAVAGGVMQSNDDNAIIRHDFNYVNDIGNILNSTEANNYYLAKPFVDFLKDNNDPRLESIAVRYVGAANGTEQVPAKATTSPGLQIGFPMGYDNGSIGPVVQSLGLKSFYDFSQVDRTRMGKRDAPAFMVTYAQTQLLMSEAAFRGWIQGSAATLYEEGIEAHMQQLSEYGEDTAVPEDEIETYVSANSLDMGNALEQINTQYWVASFLNGPEAWANFRRSGYPDLDPNPYPGKEISGDFIRRLTYPDSEYGVNAGNIQTAVSRQGADNLDTRVWWDKQ